METETEKYLLCEESTPENATFSDRNYSYLVVAVTTNKCIVNDWNGSWFSQHLINALIDEKIPEDLFNNIKEVNNVNEYFALLKSKIKCDMDLIRERINNAKFDWAKITKEFSYIFDTRHYHIDDGFAFCLLFNRHVYEIEFNPPNTLEIRLCLISDEDLGAKFRDLSNY